MNDFDAVIVGSGAGGGTAARVLTERGWRVLVLEKGPRRHADEFIPYDELHFLQFGALHPHADDDPNIYVAPDGSTSRVDRWWIANMVGGATMMWQANLPRYTDEDMRILDHLRDPPPDAALVDWPWTYQEFTPYFERAEREWGVSGLANMSPAQEPMRAEYQYPMRPLRPHASTPFLLKAFAKANMYPYFSPTGINSQTRNGRPPEPFCGFCQGFGCAVNDRASSTNTVLEWALASGRCELRTGHCVTRIDHAGGRVGGVFYRTEPDGPEAHVAARVVVVSIQAIESARLFLLSEIPDPNRMIGRFLTYHTKGSLVITFPELPAWGEGDAAQYQPRTGLGSLQLRDLYVIDDPATSLSKGGKFTLGDPYTTSTPIAAVLDTGLWGRSLQERLTELRSQAGASFSFTGESLPRWENHVELDPDVVDPWGMPAARTYYEHHPYDVELSEYALNRVAAVMTEAGGEVRAIRPQPVTNPGYGHNHGTLRAGPDPGAAVLDGDCQSHTVKGLYVLDSAFMPTSGASNPTLTAIANAYRVSENMPKDEG
jgi:choline dehydrogenase-like flavoprotein